jgi:hypothetical protein
MLCVLFPCIITSLLIHVSILLLFMLCNFYTHYDTCTSIRISAEESTQSEIFEIDLWLELHKCAMRK